MPSISDKSSSSESWTNNCACQALVSDASSFAMKGLSLAPSAFKSPGSGAKTRNLTQSKVKTVTTIFSRLVGALLQSQDCYPFARRLVQSSPGQQAPRNPIISRHWSSIEKENLLVQDRLFLWFSNFQPKIRFTLYSWNPNDPCFDWKRAFF